MVESLARWSPVRAKIRAGPAGPPRSASHTQCNRHSRSNGCDTHHKPCDGAEPVRHPGPAARGGTLRPCRATTSAALRAPPPSRSTVRWPPLVIRLGAPTDTRDTVKLLSTVALGGRSLGGRAPPAAPAGGGGCCGGGCSAAVPRPTPHDPARKRPGCGSPTGSRPTLRDAGEAGRRTPAAVPPPDGRTSR